MKTWCLSIYFTRSYTKAPCVTWLLLWFAPLQLYTFKSFLYGLHFYWKNSAFLFMQTLSLMQLNFFIKETFKMRRSPVLYRDASVFSCLFLFWICLLPLKACRCLQSSSMSLFPFSNQSTWKLSLCRFSWFLSPRAEFTVVYELICQPFELWVFCKSLFIWSVSLSIIAVSQQQEIRNLLHEWKLPVNIFFLKYSWALKSVSCFLFLFLLCFWGPSFHSSVFSFFLFWNLPYCPTWQIIGRP